MTAAHSLTSDSPDGLESPEPRRRSFWASAPGLLTGVAAILGSVVGLVTVLVQAGVIGSPSTPSQVAPAQAAAAISTPAVRTPAAEPSLERSLRRLNELLAESARTKGDLGSLIADVNADPPIALDAALREISAIVRQREALHRTLAELPAHDELSNALALLRDSITASLADDRLVRQWIVARYEGDGAAEKLWQAQLEASREATRAKTAFRGEYRAILLSAGLPSSVPDY
jgi:hypothetical protein